MYNEKIWNKGTSPIVSVILMIIVVLLTFGVILIFSGAMVSNNLPDDTRTPSFNDFINRKDNIDNINNDNKTKNEELSREKTEKRVWNKIYGPVIGTIIIIGLFSLIYKLLFSESILIK